MTLDDILLRELEGGPATVKNITKRLETRVRIRLDRLRVRGLAIREGRGGPHREFTYRLRRSSEPIERRISDHANGPKGEKRPADVIGNAVKVMRIATGEETEDLPDDGKDPAANALGKKGGVARAAKMTADRRADIGRIAATARWKKK
jgi:hypothetical protein